MIDKYSGAISYNRYSLQTSQTLILIIDKFNETEDFLILLEHYDDIAIFPNSNKIDLNAEMYQVKTGEKEISINQLLKGKKEKESIIEKLHNHNKANYEFNVSSICLIVNFPIKDIISKAGKIDFSEITTEIQNQIINALKKKNIENIELTNFSIIKTDLTNDSHLNIAENKFIDFLCKVNPSIGIGSAKNTFKSIMDILSLKQSKEQDKYRNNNLEVITKEKGVTRKEFSNIISYANYCDPITFEYLESIVENHFPDWSINKIAVAFSMIHDSIKKMDKDYFEIFRSAIDIKENNKYEMDNFKDSTLQFISDIKCENSWNRYVVLDNYFVEVIAITILCKKGV
ncbi:DUF4297 domain-containing protein [Mycoplasma cottewii]|uniref:DUF4297 domain-containing protein n=1 Tax=Mycoplasma cottewii TaxID=51364 RepID=A0ABY5TXC7_9MOLU|nr:DUF4297 domain-containing protein [Mycoplasma cottewii]UWD34651.1 DUF4297 domain-containing protein [Mycoplasma cottewii]